MIANMCPPIENLTPLLQAGLKRFNIDEPWHKQFFPDFVAQVDAQLPADGKLYTSAVMNPGFTTPDENKLSVVYR